MNIMEFAQVGTITVICFLICQTVKATNIDNKWLPTIAGAAGAILGGLGMGVIPDFPATDIYTAIAVGIVSGLAATGAHQVFKQFSDEKAGDA